jgi:hypothetical protein
MALRTWTTLNGEKVTQDSAEAHDWVADKLHAALAILDEVETSLIADMGKETFRKEVHVLDTVKTATGDLKAFHSAMAENLRRYRDHRGGDAYAVSLSEARVRLDDADKVLRKRPR